MKIDDCFPTPGEFLNSEFETLEYCGNKFFDYEELSSLASDAYAYHSANYNEFKESNRLPKSCFSFESNFNVNIDGRDGTAYIGVLIRLKDSFTFENISYYVAVQKKEKLNARLLRKFHFDYAPPVKTDSTRRQPHPVFHLQYACKLSSRLQGVGFDNSHMDPWLSEPRLYYSPMSLALLINLVLKEFQDETNLRIIQRGEWRDLIRENEKLILAPFFSICHNFFSDRHNKELLINDFYYGN